MPGLPLAALAALFYSLNLALGWASLRGWRGVHRWHLAHHLLYALSAAATLFALLEALWGLMPHALGLMVVAVALIMFPRARGGSHLHLALAVIGLSGHLLSFGLLF